MQPAAQHFLDGAVIGVEIGLVLGETALHLDLVLHRVAERTELMGDAADEMVGRVYIVRFV
jgi:hypothetical protein